MADYNIFVYIFPLNKKWCEKCGTFFLFFFRAKYFSRKMNCGISALAIRKGAITVPTSKI